MATKRFDFSGYATKNDILCADGRVIKRNAFIDNDGATVPLVYMHSHDNIDQVLGHALLENREDGVYAYCAFNNTPQGQSAKEDVLHGDLKHLSIYANHLKHNGNEVIHGNIRELSLVLAGANPGALIDTINIAHGEDEDEDAIIYNTSTINNMPCWVSSEIKHSDEDPEKKKEEEAEKEPEDPEKKEESEKEPEEPKKKEEAEKEPEEPKKKEEAEKEPEEPKKKEEAEKEPEELKKKEEELQHAEEDSMNNKKDPKAIWDSFNEDQKNAVGTIIALINADEDSIKELYEEMEDEKVTDDKSKENIKHDDTSDDSKSIKSIWSTLNDDQKKLAVLLIADVTNRLQNNEEDVKHSDNFEGGNKMTRNLFENNGKVEEDQVLSHDDMVAVLDDMKRGISLKSSCLQHGITNIDVMFPDEQAVTNQPIMVERDRNWVDVVLNGVTKNAFGRIKCIYADITADEARAKGFLGGSQYKDENGKLRRDSKGNFVDADGNRVYKEDEVIALSKRSVSPTTVYKKQRLDRNDIIDITDLEVVVWLKGEMKAMLNEEVARAILVGDGRSASASDKIDENCIKPIWTDEDFYTIKARVTKQATDTDDTIADKLIDAAVLAKKHYKGSGATIMFANEDYLTRMLLLKDTMGHRLYNTEAELASAMRVTRIVSVPVFEGLTRTDSDNNTISLAAIIMNLKDYRVGTDRKGQVTMFDDFDIDVNQEKYLIETRLSGMTTVPYSAIALEVVTAQG